MKKIIKETARIGVKIAGLIVLGLILSEFLTWLGRYSALNVPDRSHAYLVVFVGWLILIFPVGELIGSYLEGRQPSNYEGTGVERAGKFIGRLERTIILIFYLAGSLEGIAFLVLAKSIYRFGDLRKGHEKTDNEDFKGGDAFSISEYIILGSLFSYTAAIVVGVVIDLILKNLGLGFAF